MRWAKSLHSLKVQRGRRGGMVFVSVNCGYGRRELEIGIRVRFGSGLVDAVESTIASESGWERRPMRLLDKQRTYLDE